MWEWVGEGVPGCGQYRDRARDDIIAARVSTMVLNYDLVTLSKVLSPTRHL